MSGIYKGYNPVFESLRKEVFESETKSDPTMVLKIIYDTFVNILMNSSDPSIKTPEGFKAYFDLLIKSESLESLKNEISKKINSIGQSDKSKKDALEQNKQWLSQTIDQLKSAVGDKPDEIKKLLSVMAGYVPATITGLESVKTQLSQNESLVSRYISEERRRTGEEGESEEGVADKWFTKLSKDMLDTATSFAGETSSAVASKQYGSNADIQSFNTKAQDLLKKAKDLSIVGGRKGLFQMGKIETVSGKMKGKDYKVEAQNVVNDIIRTREEFNKLRYKLANVPAPPIEVTIVCPDNMKYDDQKKACVFISVPKPPKPKRDDNGGGGDDDNKPKPKPPIPTTGCDFPISITSKSCESVKQIQEKLISLDQCVADIINKSGGADGKYGKVTARITNIVYAYITKSSAFNPSGQLTQQVYDAIMGISIAPRPIDSPTGATAAAQGGPKKESLEIKISNKIFEKEYGKKLSVLSFDDFSSVVSEAYYINEDDVAAPAAMAPQQSGIRIDYQLMPCICATYDSGNIDTNCFKYIITPPVPDPNTSGTSGTSGASGSTGAKWKGLKPLRTGIYAIGYDESALSFIGKVAVGAAIGVVVVASAGALAALAPAAAGVMAGSAAAGAAASSVAVATSSSVLASLAGGATFVAASPVAVGVGALGGAAATDALSGRCSVGITINSGFISRAAMVKMTRGLINTLDGRVSDDDMQAIMATLCVVKGAFTCTVDRTKAVSAWSELKRLYQKKEKEDLVGEIRSIGTLTVSDVENFPEFDSPTAEDGGDENSDDAKDTIMESIERLEANEPTLAQNIKDLTEEQIQALIEGSAITKSSESDEGGE